MFSGHKGLLAYAALFAEAVNFRARPMNAMKEPGTTPSRTAPPEKTGFIQRDRTFDIDLSGLAFLSKCQGSTTPFGCLMLDANMVEQIMRMGARAF
jgi:hypothetical protein